MVTSLRWIITSFAVAYVLGQTDFSTRMGSCSVPVPQAFSCQSIPEWGVFLEQVKANAKVGFPFDVVLFQQSREILTRWHDKPYPPQDFYKYLCGGDEAEWPLPDGFCLFGFVAALFIHSRHLMLSEDPEFRKAADMDFQYSTTVLGKEGSVDFLDSSPWPVSILDLYININETEFLDYEQYSRLKPIPSPSFPLDSIHWQPSALPKVKRVIPQSALIAVLGTHATLSLEPVDMLRRLVVDVQLRAVFFGLEPRWCQILGLCDQGTTAISQLFKDAEKNPYGFSWDSMVERISEIYDTDADLRAADLLICTEPLAGCLMLKQVAVARGKHLPILGYFGVALLNSCPPEDIDTFWVHFARLLEPSDDSQASAVLAVNNLILSEQIFYQSGKRMPYVRAHGLYTGMSYTPLKPFEILMWRAPLFMYSTTRCAMTRFLQGMPEYLMSFKFVDESETVPYSKIAQYKAITLIPWDHALMTFYEIYSAGVPLFLPAKEWMYRFLYQRGQLSVGESMYQAIMPGHVPPHAEFAEAEGFTERPGPPSPQVGMSSAKAARGVAEDMLTRGLEASDLDTAKQYLKASLELMQDMRYFLAVAENKTNEDTYTSMGVVRRSTPKKKPPDQPAVGTPSVVPPVSDGIVNPWHPYTPFQMSTRDSNDWTRMRKGGWWLRRGVRFDAMRYWYQFSDFSRFPGLLYFDNLPELFCLAASFDAQSASEKMRRYNEKTLAHSSTFWVQAFVALLGQTDSSSKLDGAVS